MRKMFFFVMAAIALLLMVPSQNAQAQSRSEAPKVEVGVQYTFLRLRDFDTNTSGVGGRVTYNVTDNISVEGEMNFFPQKFVNFSTLDPTSTDSQRTQGLFGVKYGMRSEKAGIFGKIRPGFVHFGEGTSVLGGTSPGATEFALDIGGVFELYASRHLALRFDVGDTIIRFGNLGFTSHNLQITPSVAFRF
jgi:hypothetical protein